LSVVLDDQRAQITGPYSSVESMFKAIEERIAEIAAGNLRLSMGQPVARREEHEPNP
jgi:hypothetical protein